MGWKEMSEKHGPSALFTCQALQCNVERSPRYNYVLDMNPAFSHNTEFAPWFAPLGSFWMCPSSLTGKCADCPTLARCSSQWQTQYLLHAYTGQGSNGTTINLKQDIGLMKEDKKKEIEAKWNQLISETNKPKKLKMHIKQATISAKVIRRRKGNPDLHIR